MNPWECPHLLQAESPRSSPRGRSRRPLWACSGLDEDTAGRLPEAVKRARLINDVHIRSSGLAVIDAAAVGVKPKPRTDLYQMSLALACGAAVPPPALGK
jgi:hypothetical protein